MRVIAQQGVEGYTWSLMDEVEPWVEAEASSLVAGADELVPPPTKKTKYKSKFQPEWEKEFAGITA